MNNKNTPQNGRNRVNLNDLPKQVGMAYDYLLKGLTAKETAKLLDVSFRTVQRWKVKYHFKELSTIPETETIPQRAVKMANAGLSYSEIGRRLNRSKTSIFTYVKAAREKGKKSIDDKLQPLFNYLNSEFDILPLQSDMYEIIELVREIS